MMNHNIQEKKMLEKGKEALDIYLENFYVIDDNGGLIVGEEFWCRAEIFEIIIDACERTGEKRYYEVLDSMYQGFIAEYGDDWSRNEYNDDIMWMTIACTRAYFLTEDNKYLEQARKHFDIVYERAWNNELGGGLFWRTDNRTKNACINGPAVIAACLLAEATGDQAYMDKAVGIYQWLKENLFGTDGAVYDAYDLETGINEWASTYNQGTFIGAATKLYQYYKDETYLADAQLAADYTMNIMFFGKVINTEDSGNDLPGFKGILARWMGMFVRELDQNQYKAWLTLNAETAWSNRNSKGIMNTLWDTQTEDTFYTAWGCSAAVSLLFNCAY